ncbi:nicotinate mononucleotide-dependent phosphoribosyltransferase CobT [Roseofilum capinflatum]|uniref:UPF0284 protein PMG25_04795 n=1 Tax=Roseofilum capinflatum BLCC-M114 TaxID=3022440 RepID=A0ABT7B477_9CYAN|nr:TIGR00303 family protein [Roseofilum capinflatum]MDJ1173404.1 TIGR00303 family protein [Roseofilum capinflatum BLCC-M114]
MIRVYTESKQGKIWLNKYRESRANFACILGFTETALIPGISAAGATPEDRRYTCLADAEFLSKGVAPEYAYPLPPLQAGVSPVFISRAICETLQIPITLLNAGLPDRPSVEAVDLGGTPAFCVSSGQALDPEVVRHLFNQGQKWGAQLAQQTDYLIIGECVVGGTTTALAILTGLGLSASGKVNSSHPTCNHEQKIEVVKRGLERGGGLEPSRSVWELMAAVGDPMQPVAAGMAIAASQHSGVLLAGGTQMLAVYGLIGAIAQEEPCIWDTSEVVVGTTRWVAEDATGDTVGLAKLLPPVPLMATQLSFAGSRYSQLQMYEQGFVKEGVGAGGCAIAATLCQNWTQKTLLKAIETLIDRYSNG